MISRWAARAKSGLSRMTSRRHLRGLRIAPHPHQKRLGSEYGGWTIAAVSGLKGAHVISCGLGEDASFDVEIAAGFGATVLLVDPTPRAITHFRAIADRVGLPSLQPYRAGGDQPPEAYDLSGVHPGQLLLAEVAVGDTEGTAKFFLPPDPSHVSHSLVNFQGNYRDADPYIEVPVVRIGSLVERIDPAKLHLVKLNIEGAAPRVLDDMLETGIRPPQLCVEFDDLLTGGDKARKQFRRSDDQLRRSGYELAFATDSGAFLYLLPEVYSMGPVAS